MYDKDTKIILDLLLNQPYAKLNIDKTYVYMRCPFCGDSRTNKSETNFNISIPTEEKPKWLYICFRASCREKGYITPEFLRMLDINSFEANVALNKINKKESKNKKYKNKSKRYLENFPSTNDKLSLAKLGYINNRLGLELTLKDLIKLKIHTNLNELLRMNEITVSKKREKYYDLLSIYGISFISTYNDYVNIRNTTNSDKIRRYSIVDIFEDEEEKLKFYTIPTKIDVFSTEPIVINLAEGSFDILSVYYNLDIDREYGNHIFSAVAGSSYEKTLIHLIRQYGLIDIIVNIFSDDGIDLDAYKKLLKSIKKYVYNVEMKVYYNKKYKDFGVSKDQIEINEIYL